MKPKVYAVTVVTGGLVIGSKEMDIYLPLHIRREDLHNNQIKVKIYEKRNLLTKGVLLGIITVKKEDKVVLSQEDYNPKPLYYFDTGIWLVFKTGKNEVGIYYGGVK